MLSCDTAVAHSFTLVDEMNISINYLKLEAAAPVGMLLHGSVEMGCKHSNLHHIGSTPPALRSQF